jgi:hypothetical protein
MDIYAHLPNKGGPMQSTTLILPDDLKARALYRANLMGLSLGEFIQESLENALKTLEVDQANKYPIQFDNFVFEGKLSETSL